MMMLLSRRYLIARRVLSLTSTFQPSFSSRAAQPTFSRSSSISLLSICLHRTRAGDVRPFLLLVSLVPSFVEHPRPAAKPAECKGALTNRQSPHLVRGEASLAAGKAPAAAGHPAQ